MLAEALSPQTHIGTTTAPPHETLTNSPNLRRTFRCTTSSTMYPCIGAIGCDALFEFLTRVEARPVVQHAHIVEAKERDGVRGRRFRKNALVGNVGGVQRL